MNNIDLNTPIDQIQDLLISKGWLLKNEIVQSTSSPGEGNMNVVMRILTNERSFILKQSRPFVQKYPQVPAPIDRIDTEYQFYQAMSTSQMSKLFPNVLVYDPSDHMILMDDLGDCEDMTSMYHSRTIPFVVLSQLIEAVHSIHQTKVPVSYPDNMELRRLNHQHIFVLPFLKDNGFNLEETQEGLTEIANRIRSDEQLISIIGGLGEQYLSPGEYLLHGDYYPGSWMSVDDAVVVLDPEFSFAGLREYDLGVMVAHLIMSSGDPKYLDLVISGYPDMINTDLTSQIAGVEIIRRLLGLAQLPLIRSLSEKKELIDWAVSAIKL